MATFEKVKRFAEQSIQVDRVLSEAGLAGNAGRILLVLTMARTIWGVTQKEVVDRTQLKKDVVSKVVGSLADAGLLTQKRDSANPRMKSLVATDAGRDLLMRIRASLQQPRAASQNRTDVLGLIGLFDERDGTDDSCAIATSNGEQSTVANSQPK
jgi:DNA-binding MarR family transcriptional regulator